MKATIEIDATPQEMRELMGLPEVQRLQKEAMEKIREKMLAGIESNNISELLKMYMPMPEQMSAMEGMQKTMWDAMTKGMMKTSQSRDKE